VRHKQHCFHSVLLTLWFCALLRCSAVKLIPLLPAEEEGSVAGDRESAAAAAAEEQQAAEQVPLKSPKLSSIDGAGDAGGSGTGIEDNHSDSGLEIIELRSPFQVRGSLPLLCSDCAALLWQAHGVTFHEDSAPDLAATNAASLAPAGSAVSVEPGGARIQLATLSSAAPAAAASAPSLSGGHGEPASVAVDIPDSPAPAQADRGREAADSGLPTFHQD
jgi:hypothetical protein